MRLVKDGTQGLSVVAKARVTSVFCSRSWALAEPVARPAVRIALWNSKPLSPSSRNLLFDFKNGV